MSLRETKRITNEFINSKKREYLGKRGLLPLSNGLTIEVIAKDYKQSFGHYRYLVSPTNGSGKIWTEKVIFTIE